MTNVGQQTQSIVDVPIQKSLEKKLHPSRFTAMSGKMTAIVAYILGVVWTDPEIAWMSISSDDFVTTESDFIGTGADLRRNLANLVKAAELDEEEIALLKQLTGKIDNFSGKAIL